LFLQLLLQLLMLILKMLSAPGQQHPQQRDAAVSLLQSAPWSPLLLLHALP
jgi:hypothetical protein